MQIVTTNYNSLGKVGPHYERPEYRPPERSEPSELDRRRSSAGSPKGDRRTLSTRNTDVPAKAAPALPGGKLNPESARELSAATAALIAELPPHSTGLDPHLRLAARLMNPVYV